MLAGCNSIHAGYVDCLNLASVVQLRQQLEKAPPEWDFEVLHARRNSGKVQKLSHLYS